MVHAIWECDQVQTCWGHAFMKLRQASLQLNSFTDLVSAVRNFEEGLELFTVIAWLVWSRRNKCHFKENSIPPEKIRDAADSVLKEFRGSQKTRPERVQRQPQRWVPPEPGNYKVNYDGAYFAEEEAAGIGVVVRNELGQVMASLAEKLTMPPTVEILEALAARRAMVFMEELGLRRANFEGDSETVVKALSKGCPDRSCIGHIIKDCMSLMGCFQTCSFSHVRRQSNGVAHALARRARLSSPLSVWMESVPPDISYLVHVDVTT